MSSTPCASAVAATSTSCGRAVLVPGCESGDHQAGVARPDLQRLAGFQALGLPQRLGHDDPAGGVYGGFHGIKIAMKMAELRPLAVNF
jgi:hypothetical protein